MHRSGTADLEGGFRVLKCRQRRRHLVADGCSAGGRCRRRHGTHDTVGSIRSEEGGGGRRHRRNGHNDSKGSQMHGAEIKGMVRLGHCSAMVMGGLDACACMGGAWAGNGL